MKWVFLAFLAVYTPLLTGWLRANHKHAPKAWALLGFLPFVLGPWGLYVAPVSWAHWPGFVKGAEVSLLDAVALAVLVSMPHRTQLPLKLPFILYIAAILLSAVFAEIPTVSLFYAWQLLRVFLLYAAVAAVCQDDRGPVAVVTGSVLGLAFQAVLAVSDYFAGDLQAGGGFGHQNLLGMISYLVTFPALALLLAGHRGWIPQIGVVAGVAVAIVTASRATIGLVGAGLVALFALSVMRRPTSRKAGMGLAGALALALAAPLAINSLERRFAEAPLPTEYDERAAFEEASRLIIADHPFGIGANHYVLVVNVGGYSDRAGVIPAPGSRRAHVHNVYLLAAAETGYLGLLALVALLAAPILVAFRAASRNRKDARGELLLGLGFSLAVMAVHSLYEWVFVTFQTQYMFAILSGLIVGIARQLGFWSKRSGAKAGRRRDARPASAQAVATRTIPATEAD